MYTYLFFYLNDVHRKGTEWCQQCIVDEAAPTDRRCTVTVPSGRSGPNWPAACWEWFVARMWSRAALWKSALSMGASGDGETLQSTPAVMVCSPAMPATAASRTDSAETERAVKTRQTDINAAGEVLWPMTMAKRTYVQSLKSLWRRLSGVITVQSFTRKLERSNRQICFMAGPANRSQGRDSIVWTSKLQNIMTLIRKTELRLGARPT